MAGPRTDPGSSRSNTATRLADERVLDDLVAARERIGRAGRARLAVFARESFSSELRSRAQAENVELITLADLYA